MNEIAEKDVQHKYLLIMISVFSLCALVASYLAQYVWKIEPCYLCKLQRLPYMLLTFVPLLGFTSLPSKMIKVSTLCLLALLFVLAAYHLLVIVGLIKDFCAVKRPIGNLDDFMSMLESHVPCSEANWKLIGIPLPVFSLLASMIFGKFFIKKS